MKNSPLSSSTEIDVVAKRGSQIVVKRMTISDAKFINKKKGWTYENFQIGFHSYKNSK